jgi:sialate O-acetylesterase
MKRSSTLLALAAACAVFSSARADVKLPAIFSDHMVFQQDVAVPLWGWANPGEQVSVSFAGQKKTVQTGADGVWNVKIAKLAAGGQPQTLTVQGKNTVKIEDVLVGEVWLCSGQSNMAMNVARAKDFEREKAAAQLPQIRMFKESSGGATVPQSKCSGRWEICAPESVGGFSATAYFFGREIHKALGRPVGLINSSVGGTPIESWTSQEAQKSVPELQPLFQTWADKEASWDPAKAQANFEKQQAAWKQAVARAKAKGKTPPRPPRKPSEPRLDNHSPGNLFNGKIAPLIPYAIRGAVWYQGESNAGDGQLYGIQLPLLIRDWRSRWGEGEFPFAWVQLPNFHAPQREPVEDSGWVLVQEGMLKTLRLPNTGMAITVDVGEAGNIHPTNKQAVGHRLALWALAKVYGQPGPSCGPIPRGQRIEGHQIIVSLEHCDGGLTAKGDKLKGFAIAGADKKWVKADAQIQGDMVVVSSPEVPQPVAVRYAWPPTPTATCTAPRACRRRPSAPTIGRARSRRGSDSPTAASGEPLHAPSNLALWTRDPAYVPGRVGEKPGAVCPDAG